MAKKRTQAETIGSREKAFAHIEHDPTMPVPIPFPMLKAWTEPAMGQAAMTRWIDRAQSFSEFYQLRLRKDFETLAGLALCRTPQDVGVLWLKAASEAAQDYSDAIGFAVAPKTKSDGAEAA